MWSLECKEAFKEALLKAPVLAVVDPEPFILQMDTQKEVLGQYLVRCMLVNEQHIGYESRKLLP